METQVFVEYAVLHNTGENTEAPGWEMPLSRVPCLQVCIPKHSVSGSQTARAFSMFV